MLTKAQSKYIQSLSQQKYRKEYNQFVAEGDKIAKEWLTSEVQISFVVATETWISTNTPLISKHKEAQIITVLPHQLASISSLKTANEVLIVAQIPQIIPYEFTGGWAIALDAIQDPGNMGTIIRIADWFGIKDIILSHGCVDVYNSKVVQGAMGSHLRVDFHKGFLPDILSNINCPIYAAMLGGEDIMSVQETKTGVIVIGNESKGISDEVSTLATHKIMIQGKGGAESLNAGVSAGIICAMLTAS